MHVFPDGTPTHGLKREHGRPRPRTMAVRHRDRLPLPVRAADHRAVVPGRADADGLVPHREREVPGHDEVLGQALPHQLRHGRGHRHRAGVPVRHELERLLPLRRRRLRRAARDRGAASRSSSRPPSSGCGSSGGTGCRSSPTWSAIWMVAIATNLSAFFILAANSWMQHPVGFQINPERGRAELTSLWAVLNNSTNQVAYPHVATASFLTAAAFVIGISAWHLYRKPARRGHARVAEDGLRRRADLRRGRHGHRRPAGQGDDRAAADEDGRRRGDLGHRRRPRRSRSSPIGTPDGRAASCSPSACRTCCRSWRPATSTARSRGSATSSASPRSGSAPATTGRSSR